MLAIVKLYRTPYVAPRRNGVLVVHLMQRMQDIKYFEFT